MSHLVPSWFASLERQLTQVIEVLPYCAAHEEVWSPPLVPVLLDAGSQLDSLWKRAVALLGVGGSSDIKDFWQRWGADLAPHWLVFFGNGNPVRIEPFREWSSPTYQPLPWWQAYNKLKHDRLEHIELATLRNAVFGCASLLLAIARTDFCAEALESAGLLSAVSPDLELATRLKLQHIHPGNPRHAHLLVETRLFAYPVGWLGIEIKKEDDWQGQASSRFKAWWKQYEASGAPADV